MKKRGKIGHVYETIWSVIAIKLDRLSVNHNLKVDAFHVRNRVLVVVGAEHSTLATVSESIYNDKFHKSVLDATDSEHRAGIDVSCTVWLVEAVWCGEEECFLWW